MPASIWRRLSLLLLVFILLELLLVSLPVGVATVAGLLLALGVGAVVQRQLMLHQSEQMHLALSQEQLRARVLEAHSALATQQEQLQAIVTAVPVAVVATNVEGKITFWSPEAERVFGWSQAEVLGQDAPMVPPEFREERLRLRRQVAAGQAIASYETRFVNRAGNPVDVSISSAALRDHHGQFAGVVSGISDISSRRKLEEQLRQSQKMEAIGHLAGSIAHDFNNLLTAILCFSDHALSRLPQEERRRGDLSQIMLAAERAAALSRQLLTFSRPRAINPRVLDVARVVRGMEPMLSRLMDERITLRFHTASDAGRVLADPHHLEQVLLNLCINARDAMPDGGDLTVETAPTELDGSYLVDHPGLVAGHYTMMSVSDTGVGMDAATRQRIFEPFFTTKGSGLGTGLGLATVQGIVRESNGGITVYSEPGRGSTFKVLLPLVEADLPAQVPAPVILSSVTGKVLLVDDNEQVRSLVVAMLSEEGFTVEAYASGEDALKQLPTSVTPDVLLTDVVLGGMSGFEISDRMRERHPGMPVILMSGYTAESQRMEAVSGDPGIQYLEKPFRRAALLQIVARALSESSGRRPGGGAG